MYLENISLEDVEETFALMDDWEDRYRYLIELGRKLPPLSEDEHVEQNKVRGCASQVWIVTKPHPEDAKRLVFIGDSDAHIVKGLIAVLLLIFSGKTRAEIAAIDARQILEQLGLAEHLSPMRTNGLFSMLQRIGDMAVG